MNRCTIRGYVSWLLLVVSSYSVGDVPTALAGVWILDREKTEVHVRESPKWSVDAEKYLPVIFRRMGQGFFLFEPGVLHYQNKVKQQSFDIKLIEQSETRFVYSILPEEKAQLTFTLNVEGNLQIQSSSSNDMDYYVWKRGPIPEVDDRSEAIELIKAMLAEPES